MGSKLIIVGDKMSRHIREGGLTTWNKKAPPPARGKS
jgi:hypothetical protein